MGKSSKKSIKQSVGELKNILPAEFTGMPTIQLIGSREFTLDGCKGIAEYSDYAIKIRTSCGVVCICGHRLNIRYLSINSVVVEGRISSVEFLDRR